DHFRDHRPGRSLHVCYKSHAGSLSSRKHSVGRPRSRQGRLGRRRMGWRWGRRIWRRRRGVRWWRRWRLMVITRKKLLRIIDREKIKRAIQAAEHQASGEICVSVAPLFWGSIERAADKAFVRLGMTRTKERNGVLFFVVPARRKFVVLGDQGIHERVGQEFWDLVGAGLSEKFRDGDFTGGLVSGIEKVGQQLAVHFPFDPATDKNELSDDVDFGKW